MAIDYKKWEHEVRLAIERTRAASSEIQPALDLEIPAIIMGRFTDINGKIDFNNRDFVRFRRYASGKRFSESLFLDVEKCLSIVGEVNETVATGQDIPSQRLLDELATSQRKLFEYLLSLVMLSRKEIFSDGCPQLYLLHYHLVQDREDRRLRNNDLNEYFGVKEDDFHPFLDAIETEISWALSQLIDPAAAAPQTIIDKSQCSWASWKIDPVDARKAVSTSIGLQKARPTSAKHQFTIVVKEQNEVSELERVALGFGYQSVFGATSSQIHMNLSGRHRNEISQQSFLKAVDNALLLSICCVLRAVQFLEHFDPAKVGEHSKVLRSEYAEDVPESFIAAYCGTAAENDLVGVSEGPDQAWIGVVDSKRSANSFAAYLVRPLLEFGEIDWYTDSETRFLISEKDCRDIVAESIAKKYLSADIEQSEPAEVIMTRLGSQERMDELVMPRMNKRLLHSLYLVERYSRRKDQ